MAVNVTTEASKAKKRKEIQDAEKRLKTIRDMMNDTQDSLVGVVDTMLGDLSDKLNLGGMRTKSRAYNVAMLKGIDSQLEKLHKQLLRETSDQVKLSLLKQIDVLKDKRKDFEIDTNDAYNKLMSEARGLVTDRDKKTGRLSNDNLYHALNLASRSGGIVGMQRMRSMSLNVNGSYSYKSAQEAQSQVSRQLDAYIMSQKYAEANMGKTVANIYDYMRNNKTIMVGR